MPNSPNLNLYIGNHFSDCYVRKTEDNLFLWVHMEKKNNSMAKKEDGFLEQNQEADCHHLMHSQVKKIKEEESERNVIDWPVLAREVMTRQHSRSRLGLISGQPISVGDS